MFNPLTLDSWRARTTSVRGAAQEILHAIEVAKGYEKYRHHIKHILAEIETGSDPIISSHFPDVPSLFKGYQDPKGEELEKLASACKVVSWRLNGYMEALQRELGRLLFEGRDNEFDKLNRLTMCLATELCSMGYSTRYLRSLFTILVDATAGDFQARYRSFIRACSGDTHEYTCWFVLVWHPRILGDNIGSQQMEIVRGEKPYPIPEDEEPFWDSIRIDPFYIARVKLRAIDPFSASRISAVKLENAFAAFKLYDLDREIKIASKTVLVKRGDGTISLAELESPRLFYIRSARNPTNRIQILLSLGARLRSDDEEQLSAVLQYHKLALAASSEEACLVNMWIALECLVRRTRGNIIQKICRSIPPTIACLAFFKMMRALSIYMRLYWKQIDPSPFVELLELRDASYCAPSELLSAMLDNDEGGKGQRLLELCTDNPLMHHRIRRIQHTLLKSPGDLAKYIETNENHINWQLRRIYRARNEVAHRANLSTKLDQLLEHLHGYLINSIHRVIYVLNTSDGHLSIPETLMYCTNVHMQFIAALKTGRGAKVTRAALLDPSLIFDPTDESELAWGTEEET
jgi:hypothetical protein